MIHTHPVYTVHNECQDCYKCLRLCPVKAIKVRDGRAGVMPGRCIGCGRCVLACPGRAKKIRHDLDRVTALVSGGEKVIISLAPSWRSAFDDDAPTMISRLKALGAAEVSETALGAQDVSIRTAAILRQAPPGLYLSSACPVIVDYLRLYKPGFARNIVPLASPALTHAGALKKRYGDGVKVVFAGPCIAKKNEADRRPDLLAAALTFEELKLWLSAGPGFSPADEDGAFSPGPAHEGALYPLDGGMNETLRRIGLDDRTQLVSISTMEVLTQALEQFDPDNLGRKIFVEAQACPGGCVSGPCAGSGRSVFQKIADVLNNASFREAIPAEAFFQLPLRYEAAEMDDPAYSLEDIEAALNKIGKFSVEDEMNCAGCGYPTCRDLARALLAGNAETSMCVSYMRKLAARKAAAMLKAMPSALVMVDGELNIMEVNEAFIRMFARDQSVRAMNSPEDFIGEPVEDWLEFAHLFKRALKTGQEIQREHVSYKKRLFDLTVFCIERHESAGALVTDVTVSESGREKIALKAREVIARNITAVQEIAGLLGEHMVETEMLLSSIAEGYEVIGGEENNED